MRIEINNLLGPEITEFLQNHIEDMRATSPPESKHALDIEGLRKPEVTFWAIWDGENLAGCGAFMQLDGKHAEVKSMRTSPLYKRKGVASMLLQHLIDEAKNRGYERLSLETGSMPFFEPARDLYAKHGFKHCEPFADYKEDPNSVFMTKEL